jgi:hypothetical protein
MKNITRIVTGRSAAAFAVAGLAFLPFIAQAALPGITCGYQGATFCLVPCHPIYGAGGTLVSGKECTFSDLIILFKNLIAYMVYIAVPIAAAMFVYAGFRYITSGANASQRSNANAMLWKVLTGFVIILAAWLVVYAITSVLLKSEFNPLTT